MNLFNFILPGPVSHQDLFNFILPGPVSHQDLFVLLHMLPSDISKELFFEHRNVFVIQRPSCMGNVTVFVCKRKLAAVLSEQ